MASAELLVIGAGPYGVAVAAHARANGISTVIVGRPMGFWREHMPRDMFLRSGPDWHLDAEGVHTMEAYLAERGIDHADIDPIPIDVFLAYADWFQAERGIAPSEDLVTELTKPNGRFEATLESGERVVADAVVAAPGIRHFAHAPDWAAELPSARAGHTCDITEFEAMRGARVLIVGGRQSAYEWAALLGDHGAARIDVVHRHPVPRFARVSWRFVDAHVDSTLREPGWWRGLTSDERNAIAKQFWEVGRLTLEHWLTPRLERANVHRWPGAEVVTAVPRGDGAFDVRLSGDERLTVDHVILASGYRADMMRVPYLAGVIDRIAVTDGFPVLGDGLETRLPGLYVTGFAATRDFGPFFGFVKAAPASATLIVRDLLARA